MKINFLTLFPKYFAPFTEESIVAKAIENKLIDINIVDFRLFSLDKHHKVDDETYGGGQGMLLQIEPIDRALDSLHNRGGYKILVSPQGKVFNQKKAHELSKLDQITFISGRYRRFWWASYTNSWWRVIYWRLCTNWWRITFNGDGRFNNKTYWQRNS
nr:hypothetical protein [Mycoplasmopsis bovis]